MPHLTCKFNSSGPIVDVRIGISQPQKRAMEKLGIQPPPPVRLNLILDTGAETTMIAEQYMRTLAINARGQTDILTAKSDDKPTSCYTYAVELCIPTVGDPPFVIPALEVIGRPLFNHSIDGMIGRDVLSRMKLFIDGPARVFRLDY